MIFLNIFLFIINGFNLASSESSSTPVSPEKNCTFDLNRSKSISESTGLKQDSG